MNFEKVEKTPCVVRKPRGRTIGVIRAFVDSGFECARITDWESHYKNVRSCASSFGSAATRYGYDYIKVTLVSNQVYLINTLIEEEESV